MAPADDPAKGRAPDEGQASVAGLGRGSKAHLFDPVALRRGAEGACGVDIPLDALACDGLEILAADLRSAAPQLSFLGRTLLQQALIDRLVRRREIEPGARTDLLWPPPVFIVGPFRTGSTFLHRLLALDPRLRCPTTTEVSVPLDPSDTNNRDAGERVARYLEQVGRISPRLLELHPIAHDSPEECFGLLEPSFLSPSFLFWAHLPAYEDWLLARPESDWDSAYQIYAGLLARIAASDPGRRWVLKSPFHLWGLPALVRSFPEALFVQLSRPPEQTAPSTAELLAANRTVYARRGTVGDLRAEAARIMLGATRRAEAARQAAPDRFLDIAFDDLIRSPVSEVRRIYSALGLEFRAQDGARFANGAIDIGRLTSKS